MASSNYWHRITDSRISRRRALTLGSGAAAAAFLAACGGSDSSGGSSSSTPSGTPGAITSSLAIKATDTTKQAKRGGVLNWFTTSESPNLDVSTANLSNNDKLLLTYNVLLQVKPGYLQASDRDVTGDLAESWEWSPDRLQLTMKLRQGVKWHNKAPVNGRAFDMDDVLFSWDRVTRLSGDRGQIANVANPDAPILSMTATDPKTLVIKLKYPQSYILAILARNFGAKVNMVPKETDSTFDIRRDMIGTGAYMLSAYTPSGSYTYKVNPDYYEKDFHFVDQINQPIISEYATGLAQFKAGNLHTWAVRATDVVSLKNEAKDIGLYQGEYNAATVNTAFGFKPGSPFLDQRVRQAFSMSQDRDLWIDVFYNVSAFEKQGLPVDMRWNSALAMTEEGWWLDPKSKDMGDGAKFYTHDVAEAKKLLTAAGYANGLDVNVTHPGNASGYPTDYVRQAEVIDQMMKDAGFKTTQKTIDYVSQFVPQYRDANGKFDGLIHKVGTTVGDDAVASLASRFSSKAGTQFYGFDGAGKGDQSGDAKIDDMIAKATAEIDTEKRRALVKDMQKYMAQTQYLVRWPGGSTDFQMAWPAVQNFLVYRGAAAGTTVGSRLTPYFWWMDTTQAPKK